jgi:hypothetical protein
MTASAKIAESSPPVAAHEISVSALHHMNEIEALALSAVIEATIAFGVVCLAKWPSRGARAAPTESARSP